MNKDAESRWKVGMSNIKLKMRVKMFHELSWPHNIYFEFLAERGIIGFLALMAVLGWTVAAALKILRKATGHTRLLGGAALGGLVGLCMAGVTALTFVRPWVVVTFFTLVGLVAFLASWQDVDRADRNRAADNG